MTFDVIIIGAGWAGLTAATALKEAGMRPLVLEKSRGPGGRSATRREGSSRFDHGAQYFSARSAQFARHLQQWQDDGWVEQWKPRLAVLGDASGHSDPSSIHRFVAVPGMNGVCKRLADSLDCRFQARVASISYTDQWQIQLDGAGDNAGELLSTPRLLITAPPAQAAELLGQQNAFYDYLSGIQLKPSIAAMISFDQPIDPGFDAAFVNSDSPISWIASNSSKPKRSGNDWVLQASAAWSAQNLEHSFEELASLMLKAFDDLLELDLPTPRVCLAHRWRYALGFAEDHPGCLTDEKTKLAIAGDWLAGSRIEGAWSSADQAARWLSKV